MAEEKTYTIGAAQKIMAAEAFNTAWDYLDKQERDRDDEDAMLSAVHAQRYLWGIVGTELEVERAEWQLSRVYAVLGDGETSLRHAARCLKIVEENDIKDFDLAFAYESMARAYNVIGNTEQRDRFVDLANEAASDIKDQGDRDYTISEIKSIGKVE